MNHSIRSSHSASIPSNDPTSPYSNPTVSNYHEPLPAQPYPIGSLLPENRYPQNANPPKLFQPLKVRSVEFPNRIFLAPMRQHSSHDGKATDHHFIHYGALALRGWGAILIEASAVLPEGRISPEDMGIWSDDHISGLKRIVDYVHSQGGKIGIQLSHAGRKASQVAPWIKEQSREEGWKGGRVASAENGGWGDNVVSASDISFNPGKFAQPVAASLEYIEGLKQAYVAAIGRCKKIGVDFVDLHQGHGYLPSQFLSPLSNKRTDQYGGSYTNRIRLPLEITQLVREAWNGPLFYRISATEWMDDIEGPEKAYPGEKEEYAWWGMEQTTMFAKQLRDVGVDLLDVSAGGNDRRQKVDTKPKYQVPFASHVKQNVPNLLVSAVGNLSGAKECNAIIEDGEADIVMLAKEALRRGEWPLHAAQTLGVAVSVANQYAEGWAEMMKKG